MADQVIATKEQISKRAYELYENRGYEDGWDWADWLTAEKQLALELNETPEQRLVRVATATAHSFGGHPRMIRMPIRRRG